MVYLQTNCRRNWGCIIFRLLWWPSDEMGQVLAPKCGGSIPGMIKSKTEKLTPVASLVNGHHLRDRAGLVGPVSVGGVSCLSLAWYFSVLVHLNPAWVWTSYSRSDNQLYTAINHWEATLHQSLTHLKYQGELTHSSLILKILMWFLKWSWKPLQVSELDQCVTKVLKLHTWFYFWGRHYCNINVVGILLHWPWQLHWGDLDSL